MRFGARTSSTRVFCACSARVHHGFAQKARDQPVPAYTHHHRGVGYRLVVDSATPIPKVPARARGVCTFINSWGLAKLALLAGAPGDPAAGVALHVRVGDRIAADQPLLTVHADTRSKLHKALDYLDMLGRFSEVERSNRHHHIV